MHTAFEFLMQHDVEHGNVNAENILLSGNRTSNDQNFQLVNWSLWGKPHTYMDLVKVRDVFEILYKHVHKSPCARISNDEIEEGRMKLVDFFEKCNS